MPVYQDGYIKYIRDHIGHDLIYLVFAAGIVVNDAGHILVQRRYEFDWWDLVGGAKELHETISQAMLREAKEETGMDIEIRRLLGVYTHPDYTIRYPHGDWVQPWAVCFVCHAVGGELKPDGKETLRATFKPLDDLLPHPHPIFDRMLRDAFLRDSNGMILEPSFAQTDTKPYFPVLRRYIKQKPIILPGALAYVEDTAGHILATWRREHHVWDLPSGFSDLGETATHTAVRETKEETGLDIRPTRALGVYSDPNLMHGRYANGDEVYGVGLLVEGEVIGGHLHADGVETGGVRYMRREDLLAQPSIRPITRQVLSDTTQLHHAPFIR